jgi:methyl-accepting chemotaxis protein
MFKMKITLGKKIAGGFGVVLIVLIAVVFLNYEGVGDILKDSQQVIYGNQLMGFFVQKEIDHLNWAGKVNALLTDDSVVALDVETDEKKCELGKWLIAEGRRKAEKQIPTLAGLFKALENAHKNLHQSAVKINEVFKPADTKLPAKMVKFEVELLEWVARIQDALANEQTSLGVATDPSDSELGKWLRSTKEGLLFKSAGKDIKELWNRLLDQHSDLLETAVLIEENLGGFDQLNKARQAKEQITAEWSDINDELFAMIQKAKMEIVEPARTAAIESGNLSEVVQWREIEAAMEFNFKETLLSASLAVAKISKEDALMLPQILEDNRQKINSSLSSWKQLVKNNPLLIQVTADFEKQTGKWIVGGLRYVQALMDEANAQATIDDATYIFEKETLTKLKESLHSLRSLQKYADDAISGMKKANEIYAAVTVPALESFRKILNQIKKEERGHIASDNIIFETARKVRRNVSIAGFAAIVCGILVAMFITRGISGILRRFSSEIDEGAQQVTVASAQIAATSQSLAERSSHQASALEETAASIEKIVAKTRQNAEHSHTAESVMRDTKSIVRTANNTMDLLEDSMAKISSASNEMSGIIKTIDEIAFQTNLLALNAAVEAARAGEAGTGFAVVADEVRNLAMRSANAARDTSDLIVNTTKMITDGTDLVKKTNTDFNNVEESILNVSELVNAISLASDDQARGLNQINGAVSEIDQSTRDNAASTEESASAAEELHAQAERMKKSVEYLKAMIEGKGNGGEPIQTKQVTELINQAESQLPAAVPVDEFADF